MKMIDQVLNTLNELNDSAEESVNIQKVQSEYSNPPTHTGRTNSVPTKSKPSLVPTFIPEVDMEEIHSMEGVEGNANFGPPQGES